MPRPSLAETGFTCLYLHIIRPILEQNGEQGPVYTRKSASPLILPIGLILLVGSCPSVLGQWEQLVMP